MKRRTGNDPLRLAERYITEHEIRVMRQKQAIEGLKRADRPTADAERVLKMLEVNLLKLRNHQNIMRELIDEGSQQVLQQPKLKRSPVS